MEKLTAKMLRSHFPKNKFEIDNNRPAPDFRNILGQKRATKALKFGVDIQQKGYNLYIGGESGIGRTNYVLNYLNSLTFENESPSDWVYINNFESPHEPRYIELPGKLGRIFQKDIDAMIKEILAIFPAVFDHISYQQKKRAIEIRLEENYEKLLQGVKELAGLKNIAFLKDDEGFSFSPIINGEVSEIDELDEVDQEKYKQEVLELEETLNQHLLALPQWQRDHNKHVTKLQHHTILQAIKKLFEENQKKYQGHTGLQLYLAQMHKHLPQVISEHFNSSDENEDVVSKRKLLEALYRPNLLVKAEDNATIPIILESNPTYGNLFGYIRSNVDSNASPDYHCLVGGAVHRANGGFLLLDIEKVLLDETSWETIKRILREEEIKIEIAPFDHGLSSGGSLRAESIPLNLKVILFGPRDIYYSLSELDPDFDELFSVFVDFGSEFDASDETLLQFSYLLKEKTQEANLLPLTTCAIRRLAEFACRLAEHQNRLSTHIKQILDIAVEASYWGAFEHANEINELHIEKALYERKSRHSRLCEQTIDEILSNSLKIETTGSVIGQMNGLSIIQVGDSRFGSPIRITATVHPGKSGVVDIEREVELGQAVHSKGVLLLSAFLTSRYAKKFPLAISAHIAIEQSYGYIDGDSASLAELCALLSALIEAPLRQDIAITGSVSQFGEAQAIGGVNEKIEGFFDICKARGFTGTQGVIIPTVNTINLMLSEEIIEAVRNNEFVVYAVDSVDEAMHILTGEVMGEANEKGEYDENALNSKIIKKLEQCAQISKDYKY